MKENPTVFSFNGGEISPLMVGRADLKPYGNSCRRLRNFIPSLQGPARRRPGTRFIQPIKDETWATGRAWLLPFVINANTAFILEFQGSTIRVYTNHGYTGTEITGTPWGGANFTTSEGTFNMRCVQNGNTLYLVNSAAAPQQLVYDPLAGTFTLSAVQFNDGPFNDVDLDTTTTVYASAVSGAGINLVASSNIFQPTVFLPQLLRGCLVRLEQKNVDDVKMWEPGKVLAAGVIRRSDGKNYKSLNAATTGTIKPIHSQHWSTPAPRVAKFDGDAGVQWEFQDPGYGWARITDVVSGTIAVADVISQFPASVVGAANATTRWAIQALNGFDGWPDDVCIFRERLIFWRNRQFFGSVSGDFSSFQEVDNGVVAADLAISGTAFSETGGPRRWVMAQNQAMIVGTSEDEIAIYEGNINEAFGPGNITARTQSRNGSRNLPALAVGEGLLFVQRAGKKIRDMKIADAVDTKWVSADITILAEHIVKSGIYGMAYTQEPDSVIWFNTGGGALVGFTMNREQEVKGWHPHRIGGYSNKDKTQFAFVESIASIPAPAGTYDELWMIVRRTINGVTRRYVEFMEKMRETGDDPFDSFFVDSGLSLSGNAPSATLTCGGDQTVVSEAITPFTVDIPSFVSGDVGRFIHVRYSETSVTGGLTWKLGVAEIVGFVSSFAVTTKIRSKFPASTSIYKVDPGKWRMTVKVLSGLSHLEGEKVQILTDGAVHKELTVVGGSITLDAPASYVHVGLACPAALQPMPVEPQPGASTKGQIKRPHRVTIGFHETLGCRYGREETGQMDQILTRGGGDNMDQALPLFTGEKTLSWPDGYSDRSLITVLQDQPLPCTVTSITVHGATGDGP